MARRRKLSKRKSRKSVKVKLLARMHTGKVTEPYKIMESLIKTERADLKDLKIGIAWRAGWRPDPDGRLQMGKCKKRTDLDRELNEYDFVILLNEEAWPTLKEKQRERWLFHELLHAQLTLDKNGTPVRDDRGRFVCRVRKHDFEEFQEIIEKYGHKEKLSDIAKAGIADAERPLLKGQ